MTDRLCPEEGHSRAPSSSFPIPGPKEPHLAPLSLPLCQRCCLADSLSPNSCFCTSYSGSRLCLPLPTHHGAPGSYISHGAKGQVTAPSILTSSEAFQETLPHSESQVLLCSVTQCPEDQMRESLSCALLVLRARQRPRLFLSALHSWALPPPARLNLRHQPTP